MQNKINVVVKTYSIKERERLINYIAKYYLLASITSGLEGFQYVGISIDGKIVILTSISEKTLETLSNYEMFSSSDDFIQNFDGWEEY